MRIDHVIYAAEDLDSAATSLGEALGVLPGGGGRHEGHGTCNEIFPLGGGYLEVLAIADANEAAGSPLGSALASRLESDGDGLWSWAVVVDDVDAVAERLGTEIVELTRDGLSARLTGVAEALGEPGRPFFVERSGDSADPGEGGELGGITWLELAVDEAALAEWLDGADLPLRFVDEGTGLVGVGIGDQELR